MSARRPYACVDTIHDDSRLRLAQQQSTFHAVDSVLQIRRDYLQGPMGRNDAGASGLGAMPSRAGKRPVSTRHQASSRAQLLPAPYYGYPTPNYAYAPYPYRSYPPLGGAFWSGWG
jgi:hypothetical protein